MESAFSFVGVLLEVCKREGRCCSWSPDATTSHILELRLSLLQALMSVSLPLFVSSPSFTICYCLQIFHSQPSKLLESCLSSVPVIVVSRVPSCILLGVLIALLNHQGRSNTKILLSISAPCQYDLTHDFVYPSCSTIQENIIFDHTNNRFSLEVLTPIRNVNLDVGIWESSFPFPSIRSSCCTKRT
jgi:hypothetical protein